MPTVEELRHKLSNKSSEELTAIIQHPHDWSDEAIEAAKICLTDRGDQLPGIEIATNSSMLITPQYAGIFDRFIASVIDSTIVGVSSVIISYLIFSSNPEAMSTFAILLCVVGAWLYSALQESSSHMATIGKRSMSIKVGDCQSKRLSFGMASGRHFAKYLSSIFLIGFFMALLTKRHQALHDILSGSLVYSEKI